MAQRAAARAATALPEPTVVETHRDSAPNTRPPDEAARAYAPDGTTREGRIVAGFAAFRHKHGCPVDPTSVRYDPEKGDAAAEGGLPARMEGYDVPLPGNLGLTTIVRCLECGSEIRVDPTGSMLVE